MGQSVTQDAFGNAITLVMIASKALVTKQWSEEGMTTDENENVDELSR